MILPERSDVDISVLFKWGKKINIYDVNNEILYTCYIRLVGDADVNRARVFALRRAAELRKTLRNPDSDEHVAFIADKEGLTKEELIKYVEIFSGKKLSEKAYKEISIPFPKEPSSDAPMELQEKYQYEVDHFTDRINQAAKDYITKEITKLEKELEAKDFDSLYAQYENLVTDDLCETEMIRTFREMCVFNSVYEDAGYTKKVFSKLSDYQSLPTEIKKQFEEEYESIEIDVDTLKKLRGATL